MRFKTRSAGFSLIEMAIGLLIVGLISGPMMMEYTAWKNSQLRDLTVGNEYKIQSALTKYAQNNGCYPLPAAPGVTSAAATFGLEIVRNADPIGTAPCRDITAGELAAIPACTGNDTVVCKVACVASATCTGGTPPSVIIGDPPFATLGLPKQYAIDGFRRKFTYAVSSNLLQSSTFNNSQGVVRVQDRVGGGPPGPATPGGAPGGPAITNAHYALISHGRDGVGAFTLDGGVEQATCAGSGVDLENCNNNGNFNNGFDAWTKSQGVSSSLQYDRVETSVAGANHFDDFVLYSTTISSDIWAKNNSSDIVSNTGSAGNVLVKYNGTVPGAANPQARMDIRGNVSADGVWTNTLCDTSANSYASPTYSNRPCVTANTASNNAFNPSVLGGTPATKAAGSTGIHCGLGSNVSAGLPNTVGMPMVGIASSDELCASVNTVQMVDSVGASMTIAACPVGQAPYGVLAGGALVCWTTGTAHP